jgi:dUTP pyrophosphatase
MVNLRVKLVHPAAKLPTRMTRGSAGLDLYAVESVEIPPTRCDPSGRADVGRVLVPIGIKLELPPGTVGRIASRSGLSVNSNVEVGAGWVDNDYRGELKVELKNFSSKPYRVNPGDRIAQLVILPLVDVEVESAPSLKETGRNSSGFGATDSKHEK